jgi:hypothetical protein
LQSSVHTTENLLFITLLQLLAMMSVPRAGYVITVGVEA